MDEEKKPTPLKIQRPIAELLAEIDAMDSESFPPTEDVGNDRVVGKVPEYPRKIYALGRFYERIVDEDAFEQKYKPERERSLTEAVYQAQIKAFFLNKFFWWYVRRETFGSNRKTLGVRRDWIIVEEEGGIQNFLEFLRGQQ
jgi:hypothetical protein